MNTMRMDNGEVSFKAKKALLDIILQGGADGRPFKLDNEDALSQQIGVSRNVLRDALMSLEVAGVVTRRRSKGTIANPVLANTGGRLDIGPEIADMIEQAGYRVRVETQRLGFEFKADPVFEPAQDSYLNVEKIFFADDIAAVYCIDHISGVYASRRKDAILTMKSLSHYKFVEKYCDTTMAYSLAHIDAVLPQPWLCRLMGLSPGEPVLSMEDYAHNDDHEIVAHSMMYFRSGFLDLKFLRKSW